MLPCTLPQCLLSLFRPKCKQLWCNRFEVLSPTCPSHKKWALEHTEWSDQLHNFMDRWEGFLSEIDQYISQLAAVKTRAHWLFGQKKIWNEQKSLDIYLFSQKHQTPLRGSDMVSEVWVKRFGRNEETWSVGDKTFNVQRKKILCKLILPGFFLNIKVLVLYVSTLVFLMLNCIRANFRRQNIFALPFLLEKRREKRKTSSSFFTYTLNIGKHNCMVCGVYEAFFRGLRGGW